MFGRLKSTIYHKFRMVLILCRWFREFYRDWWGWWSVRRHRMNAVPLLLFTLYPTEIITSRLYTFVGRYLYRVLCKKCILLFSSSSPSLKALLICLATTDWSFWNNSAICCWVSQTVSSSILTSSLMVSSGWYITISPVFDSMLFIPSFLSSTIIWWCKGRAFILNHQMICAKSAHMINYIAKGRASLRAPFNQFTNND